MTAPSCPDPTGCPVPDPTGDLVGRVPSTTLTARRRWYTSSQFGPGFNRSGRGNARFSPLDHPSASGSLYLAVNPVGALLETALREVWGASPATIRLAKLSQFQVFELEIRLDVDVADLRDPVLDTLGIERRGLVATSQEHYGCTRQWAASLVEQGHRGLIWHSRMAELAAPHGSSLVNSLTLSQRSHWRKRPGLESRGWRRGVCRSV